MRPGERRFSIGVDGARLAALSLEPPGSSGRGKGPTLVFLHEGLGCIATWRDVPHELVTATGCPGLVYDRRGHGRSDPLATPHGFRYMHDEAARLPRILDACGIDRGLLIGHSDGGSIALMAAASAPERVLAVITEGAHVFVEPESIAGIRATTDAFAATDLRRRLMRHHGAGTDALFRAWSDVWLGTAFRRWNIEEVLPAIRCPLLVIQGTEDEYGTPAQVDAICRQTGGEATPRLIPDCGHAPHHQARKVTLAAMTGFIRRLVEDVS